MHKTVLFAALMLGVIPTSSADREKSETRIYPTDSIGTIDANNPHFVLEKDGRILPTDSIGTKIGDSKKQYRIIGDSVHETDVIGTVRQDSSRRIK
ncbi:MAG: hypothetical protein R6W74_06750 [Nitrosomonas halophila]